MIQSLGSFEEMMGALDDVGVERRRQEQLRVDGRFVQTCADPAMDPLLALAVLAEEFGEVARAVVEQDLEQAETELIQVAAVAVAWVEGLRARRTRA